MSESTIGRRFLGRLVARLAVAPVYQPAPGDLRFVSILGMELPVRATVAVLVAATAISLDWSRTFIPPEILALGRAAPAIRFQAQERVVLYGLIPLAIVVLGFRDRPGRYGLAIGEWRIGLPAAIAGVAVMTPVVLLLARQPDFHAYYAPSAADLPSLLVTNLLDLPSSEFLLRGFLMFALVRRIGSLAVVIATLPFVFSHLGKPEIELLSTFFGGVAYGWLDWRTGSIAWSSLAHVAIATLLVAAAR